MKRMFSDVKVGDLVYDNDNWGEKDPNQYRVVTKVNTEKQIFMINIDNFEITIDFTGRIVLDENCLGAEQRFFWYPPAEIVQEKPIK